MGRYSDVMLVSDDQIQFKAHKIVLSACSPVFKKIIERSSNHHPLIYLRAIQSYEIESIIQFMYHGEGKCYYERMRELLKVAQDLEVKNISGGVELPSEEGEETVEENTPEKENEEILFKEFSGQAGIAYQISQMSSRKSSQCPECGALYSERSNMLRHYRSKHEGVKYSFAQCSQQFSQQSNVHKHMESVHDDSSILALSVIIKLQKSVVFRLIFSLYMKVSNIHAVSVIIKQHNVVDFRLIFKLSMKESSILVIIVVIKPIENICFCDT